MDKQMLEESIPTAFTHEAEWICQRGNAIEQCTIISVKII